MLSSFYTPVVNLSDTLLIKYQLANQYRIRLLVKTIIFNNKWKVLWKYLRKKIVFLIMFITPLTLTRVDHYCYSFIKCQVKRWIMLKFCRVSWNYMQFIWHIFILEIQILWKKILKNDDRTFIGMNSNNERFDYCFYFPCILYIYVLGTF